MAINVHLKREAHRSYNKALYAGNLIRISGHHEDYAKPLDSSCHGNRHRGVRGPRRHHGNVEVRWEIPAHVLHGFRAAYLVLAEKGESFERFLSRSLYESTPLAFRKQGK